MLRIAEQACTFDDVLLLPGHSTVKPREVDLSTNLTAQITLRVPLLSAAMDTVTEAKMAIALAQEGGLGVIHKNMSIEQQAEQVLQVKKFEAGMVNDPITVTPNTTVGELQALTQKYHFSGMPVVEGDEQLVGIVTSRDIRFVTDLAQPIAKVMTPKERLVTVQEGASKEDVLVLLHQHRIEKVLVVNDKFALKGMVTVRDILQAKEKPLASKDDKGRLLAAAAVGTADNTPERVAALVAAGVDVLFVDTAHGHSQGVLDQITWIKKHYPDVQIVGGNIATGAAALALAEAGADAVKVGVGPGSICTTRIVTGVGVPQLTAIANAVAALKKSKPDVGVIADGGIRFSGDLAKAIVAGAHCVMLGGLFGGTDESPGEVELYKGRAYKTYRGMGSLGAMSQSEGSKDRYFQSDVTQAEKMVPEGVEGRVPHKGSVLGVTHQLLGGLRSAMGYTGCDSIEKLRTKAEFVQVTGAGMRESHVHDVKIAKAPPNYQTETE